MFAVGNPLVPAKQNFGKFPRSPLRFVLALSAYAYQRRISLVLARWPNTVLANVKNSLLATPRAVAAKHLPRYLGAFAWRFNRRVVLKTIHERLASAAAATPPMPYRLKLAEARW